MLKAKEVAEPEVKVTTAVTTYPELVHEEKLAMFVPILHAREGMPISVGTVNTTF